MSAPLLGVCDVAVDLSSGQEINWSTSKIGGKPDWVHASDIPMTICAVCGKKLVLVTQVYCPHEASPYHRTLYLLACTNRNCWNKTHSWKIYRSQVRDSSSRSPSSSKTHPADEWGVDASSWGDTQQNDTSNAVTMATDWCDKADEWGDDGFEEGSNDLVAMVTGKHEDAPAEKATVSPADLNFHEMNIDDTSDIEDKQYEAAALPPVIDHSAAENVTHLLSGFSNTAPASSQDSAASEASVEVLKEFYLNVYEEPQEPAVKDSKHVKDLLEDYQRREGDIESLLDKHTHTSTRGEKGGKGGGEGYEKGIAKHGDIVFQKFIKKVSLCPEQCLRYHWNGKPLYISNPSALGAVPSCPSCGGERVFEFQLMPALVNLLQVPSSNGCVLEFGTVLVFTCKNSCWHDKQIYLEEYVVVQADPDQHLFK